MGWSHIWATLVSLPSISVLIPMSIATVHFAFIRTYAYLYLLSSPDGSQSNKSRELNTNALSHTNECFKFISLPSYLFRLFFKSFFLWGIDILGSSYRGDGLLDGEDHKRPISYSWLMRPTIMY